MRQSTSLWIRKAEGDFRSMHTEMDSSDPNFDDVCFHAQQCTEKLLKAIMIEYSVSFPKIHDLRKLVNLVIPLYPDLEDLKPDLARIHTLSLAIRYPYAFALRPDAEECVALCIKMRERLQAILRDEEGNLFPNSQHGIH